MKSDVEHAWAKLSDDEKHEAITLILASIEARRKTEEASERKTEQRRAHELWLKFSKKKLNAFKNWSIGVFAILFALLALGLIEGEIIARILSLNKAALDNVFGWLFVAMIPLEFALMITHSVFEGRLRKKFTQLYPEFSELPWSGTINPDTVSRSGGL